MKKLFISVPMKGRTQENIKRSIKRLKGIADAIAEEELELIDSYKPEFEDKDPIYCLGQSISMISEADIFIGVGDLGWRLEERFIGCGYEANIAQNYGKEVIRIPGIYVLPDLDELKREADDKGSYDEMRVVSEYNPDVE